jgi:hypothetical protein
MERAAGAGVADGQCHADAQVDRFTLLSRQK